MEDFSVRSKLERQRQNDPSTRRANTSRAEARDGSRALSTAVRERERNIGMFAFNHLTLMENLAGNNE